MNAKFPPIPQFVSPLPDESCYSILCRCAVRAAVSADRFRKLLFGGTRSLYCFLWQPFRVTELSQWFDNPNERIPLYLEQHSCAPYRYPFLEKRCQIYLNDWHEGEILSKGQGIRLAHELGYRKWQKKHLYYCPACAEDDRKQFGETYWHMIPQLPGIWVCPVHMVPLEQSDLLLGNTIHDLLPAEYWLPNKEPRKETISYDDLRIATESKWIMENGWNKELDLRRLVEGLSVWDFEQAEAAVSLCSIPRSVKGETLYYILLAQRQGKSIADYVK